jgi:uncharacterized protein
LPRSSSNGPINNASNGVHVAVRLSPRSKSDRLIGLVATAREGRVLKATVTAPAQDGRANEALLQLLARTWHLPRRNLSIVAGATSRNKTVRVTGEPDRLIAKLSADIASLPGL